MKKWALTNPFFFLPFFNPVSTTAFLRFFLSLLFSPPKDPADSGGDIPDPDRGYSGREGVWGRTDYVYL